MSNTTTANRTAMINHAFSRVSSMNALLDMAFGPIGSKEIGSVELMEDFLAERTTWEGIAFDLQMEQMEAECPECPMCGWENCTGGSLDYPGQCWV